MPTEGSKRISNSKVGTYKINACKANGYLKYVMKMPYARVLRKNIDFRPCVQKHGG